MAKLRITKEFRFEGAHALMNYNGKCKNIHGHSYILYVTVVGEAKTDPNGPDNGMVIDFKLLKDIVNKNVIDKFDHALVLEEGTPLSNELSTEYPNVYLTNFRPTTENLICFFAQAIKENLPQGINLYSLKLHETASSYIEWFAEDN
ncbi:MAG: 6-carboxytetrahydropterin synthase [Bacteroidales bacterium]|jgi:6-pyruvoyltetrahydropterin/6-carboxytetrahydropterin synthase|nr:6-carboxytetrahydropterin synthase [Bacteroidales bacterium]MBR6541420.1 6-carboxytetrahydropterin synthase [Bacteroidales bacterium]